MYHKPSPLFLILAAALTWLATSPLHLAHAAPTVVASIKPIHSLVSAVMEGVGRPSLLIPEGASSHHFALSPSHLKMITQADVVFWIGPEYEFFLAKPLRQAPENVQSVVLMNSPGLLRLPQSTSHHHESHTEATHEAHDHTTAYDPHIWLNPNNAIAIVNAVATTLASMDPDHAEQYARNAERTSHRLRELDKSLIALFMRIQNRGFLVYHDGLQYLTEHYHLASLGVVTNDPELPLSAKHIQDLQERIQSEHIVCVFREPEFQGPSVDALFSDLPIRSAQIDTLAATPAAGPEAYFSMMSVLARTMTLCLKDPAAGM